MTEAHAGLQAVKLGISMGFNSVDIIGDSRIVIKKCKSTMLDKSIIGEIIRDIQSRKKNIFKKSISSLFKDQEMVVPTNSRKKH